MGRRWNLREQRAETLSRAFLRAFLRRVTISFSFSAAATFFPVRFISVMFEGKRGGWRKGWPGTCLKGIILPTKINKGHKVGEKRNSAASWKRFFLIIMGKCCTEG